MNQASVNSKISRPYDVFKFLSLRSIRFKFRKIFPAPLNIKTPPENPSHLILGEANPDNNFLIPPSIIWTYWEGASSRVVQACVKSWSHYNNDIVINQVSPDNIKYYLPDFPSIDSRVWHQHKSDLIRLMLLERYGGIWLDASTLLCKDIGWVFCAMKNYKCEALLFFNQHQLEYRRDHKNPILENGFIAACPSSSYITAWRQIYQEWLMAQNYQTSFFSDSDFEDIVKNFINKSPNYLSYFICYIASQKALLTTKNIRIACMNSEEDFYFHYYDTKKPMDRIEFSKRLLLTDESRLPQTRIIKIPGGHRQKLDQFIDYSCFNTNTLLGKFL
jgi:hypothetical protein